MTSTSGRIVEIVKQHVGPNRAERRTKYKQRVRNSSLFTGHPSTLAQRTNTYAQKRSNSLTKQIRK